MPAPRRTAPCGRRRGRHAARFGRRVGDRARRSSRASCPSGAPNSVDGAAARGERAGESGPRAVTSRAGCSERPSSMRGHVVVDIRPAASARPAIQSNRSASGIRAAPRSGRAAPRRTPARYASANEPRSRSASRVPRCQARNSSRLRRIVGGSSGQTSPTDIAILHIGRRQPLASADYLQDDASRPSRQAVCAGYRRLPGHRAAARALLERAAGPLVVDLLWHLPTGRHRPPRRADGRATLDPSDWPHRHADSQGRAARAGLRPRGPTACAARDGDRHPCSSSISTSKATSCSGCCRSAPSASSAARSSASTAKSADRASRLCRRARARPSSVKPIEPVYPLTAGLSPRVVQQGRRAAPWSARRNCRNGSTRRCEARRIGPPGTRRSPPRMRRRARPISPPTPRARAPRL